MSAKGRAQTLSAVEGLLKRHGQTYCEEIGIDIAPNTPEALFRWLCATILFSTRIRADAAVKAAKALAGHGWTTPRAISAATWDERTRVLNRAGYARYDESTSTKLADAAELVQSDCDGDLRNLREKAGRDPKTERRLIEQVKGIGEVGSAIFCREAQAAWEELYPFADRRALDEAERLGLGHSVEDLAALVPEKDFPRLVAALVRADLSGEH